MRDSRRTRVVLALLLICGFALITVDARGARGARGARNAEPGPVAGLREFGQAVLGPVEDAGAAAVDGVGLFFQGWHHSSSDQRTIRALEAQVAALKRQREAVGQDRARAEQLDKLLKITALGGLTTVPARLVALAPAQDGSWSATIDAGTRDGVVSGQTVIDGDGLLGRTVSAGPFSATVLLAIDPNSTIGVRLAGVAPGSPDTIGVATGQGPGTLRVQFLDPQLRIRSGTPLVSLGSVGGGPFVAGVPVGVVRQVVPTPGALTRTVLVTPYANVADADTVAVVVQPERTDPRDAMLPGVAPPSS